MKKITLLIFLALSAASTGLFAQVNEAVLAEDPAGMHALKFNFLSPAFNYYLELSYERNLKPKTNLEISLGYIGLGDKPDVNHLQTEYHLNNGSYSNFDSYDIESAQGGFARIGVKYMNFMDSEFSSNKRHPFAGEYLKPELTIGAYGIDVTRLVENGGLLTTMESRPFGAFILNLGAQGVIADKLLFDIYIGAGYGTEKADDYVGNYAFFMGNQTDGFSLCGQAVVKLGILLNKP